MWFPYCKLRLLCLFSHFSAPLSLTLSLSSIFFLQNSFFVHWQNAKKRRTKWRIWNTFIINKIAEEMRAGTVRHLALSNCQTRFPLVFLFFSTLRSFSFSVRSFLLFFSFFVCVLFCHSILHDSQGSFVAFSQTQSAFLSYFESRLSWMLTFYVARPNSYWMRRGSTDDDSNTLRCIYSVYHLL